MSEIKTSRFPEPWSEDVLSLIEGLETPYQKVAIDMVVTTLKMVQEASALQDLTMVASTLRELRQSFKVFAPYRDTRKVCIFGSARTPEEDPNYIIAQRFSEAITAKGYMVITGAGPGIMEAGNRGALPEMDFGVNIRLPFEQEANPYIRDSSKLVSFKYFFNRKLVFLKESDATVLFPGGFGTHDEAFESLTLLQTGRCAPRPLILLADEKDDYWRAWDVFVKNQIGKKGYISDEDLSLYTLPKSAEEAVAEIELFYSVYHSVRYFQDLAVLRLNQVLSDQTMKEINLKFKDLVLTGAFEQADTDQFTLDRSDYIDKPRLLFKFDRMSYGRLCQLIMFINKFEAAH